MCSATGSELVVWHEQSPHDARCVWGQETHGRGLLSGFSNARAVLEMRKWSQVYTSLWQFQSESLVESLKELHFEAGRIWRVSRLSCTFRSTCPQCFVFFWLADRAEALGVVLGLFLSYGPAHPIVVRLSGVNKGTEITRFT